MDKRTGGKLPVDHLWVWSFSLGDEEIDCRCRWSRCLSFFRLPLVAFFCLPRKSRSWWSFRQQRWRRIPLLWSPLVPTLLTLNSFPLQSSLPTAPALFTPAVLFLLSRRFPSLFLSLSLFSVFLSRFLLSETSPSSFAVHPLLSKNSPLCGWLFSFAFIPQFNPKNLCPFSVFCSFRSRPRFSLQTAQVRSFHAAATIFLFSFFSAN